MKIILFPELYDEQQPGETQADRRCSPGLPAADRQRLSTFQVGRRFQVRRALFEDMRDPGWLFLRHETLRTMNS